MAKKAYLTRNGRPGGDKARPANGRARRGGVPPLAWLGLAGLLLVALGLFFVRQSLAGSAAPAPSAAIPATGKAKLAVDRETIDFGRVPLNKPVKATFKLTNVGDRPLTLNGTPEVQALKGC